MVTCGVTWGDRTMGSKESPSHNWAPKGYAKRGSKYLELKAARIVVNMHFAVDCTKKNSFGVGAPGNLYHPFTPGYASEDGVVTLEYKRTGRAFNKAIKHHRRLSQKKKTDLVWLQVKVVPPQPVPTDLTHDHMAIGVRNANLATVGTPRHVAYKAHVPVVDHLFVPFPLKPKTVKEEGKKGTPRSSRKVAVLPPHMQHSLTTVLVSASLTAQCSTTTHLEEKPHNNQAMFVTRREFTVRLVPGDDLQ
jgi:hypothetical protein